MSDQGPTRNRLSRRQSRIGCADSPNHPGRLNRPQRRPRRPEGTSVSTAEHGRPMRSRNRSKRKRRLLAEIDPGFNASGCPEGLLMKMSLERARFFP